jgi:hypothetical protein
VPTDSRVFQFKKDLGRFASQRSDPKLRLRRFSRFTTPFCLGFYLAFCLAFLVAPQLRAAGEATVSFGNHEQSEQQIAAAPHPQPPPKPLPPPKIKSVKFVSMCDNTGTITLAIDGENFGNDSSQATVTFETKDPAQLHKPEILSVTPTEILVKVSSGPTIEITKITVAIDGKTDPDQKIFTVSLKPNPPAPKTTVPSVFNIKIEPETDKEFPNLHTLIATKESGEGGFGDDRDLIALELVPPGATAVNIDMVSNDQLNLSFVAAADYVPKSLSVTVYGSSDIKTRKPTSVAKPAPDKTADPNQPKITSVETVFLDRSQGNGRIRIYGQGFGDYDSKGLPFLADDYLRCDLMRPFIKYPPSRDPSQQIDFLKAEQTSWQDQRDNDDYCKKYELYREDYLAWRTKIRRLVEPGITSREPALNVQRIEVLYIDDKVVDIYFEFFRRRGYSEPFRLENATLSIRKSPVSTIQTVKGDCGTGEVTGPVEVDYVVKETIDPQPNPSLTYSYSVLDHDSAKVLFGAGVAHNFYVVKLSVVNTGKKKISIPLASIQAEVEWARGQWLDEKHNREIDYFEGPATITPVPLAAVSAYFNSDYKVTGARAITLNILDGITTLGSAAVPFAGPSFKIGASVFTAGFVPGLRKYIGDLSDQQLQTLTGQSWQSSETVAANGGSIDKFVYIQRKGPSSDEPVDYSEPVPPANDPAKDKSANTAAPSKGGSATASTAASANDPAKTASSNSAAPTKAASFDTTDPGPPNPASADNSNAVSPQQQYYRNQTAKKLTNIIGLEVTGYEVPDAPPVTATPAGSSSQQGKPSAASTPSSSEPTSQPTPSTGGKPAKPPKSAAPPAAGSTSPSPD